MPDIITIFREEIITNEARNTDWTGAVENNLTHAIFCDLCGREETKERRRESEESYQEYRKQKINEKIAPSSSFIHVVKTKEILP